MDVLPDIAHDDGCVQQFMWFKWCFAPDVTIPFLTPHNKWTLERDLLNDRGEQAVVRERYESCKSVGVIPNPRGGTWAFPKTADNSIHPGLPVVVEAYSATTSNNHFSNAPSQ